MSEYLINQYKELHRKNPGYGYAATYLSRILKICKQNGYDSAIDYGCGKGLLADKLIEEGIECFKYDPAIPSYFDHPDRPADIVICNDVMEHLTEETCINVLEEIDFLAISCAFFNISCRPAVHVLPDGTNCHTLVKDKDWWEEKLSEVMNLRIEKIEYFEKNENLLVVMKRK